MHGRGRQAEAAMVDERRRRVELEEGPQVAPIADGGTGLNGGGGRRRDSVHRPILGRNSPSSNPTVSWTPAGPLRYTHANQLGGSGW